MTGMCETLLRSSLCICSVDAAALDVCLIYIHSPCLQTCNCFAMHGLAEVSAPMSVVTVLSQTSFNSYDNAALLFIAWPGRNVCAHVYGHHDTADKSYAQQSALLFTHHHKHTANDAVVSIAG